MLLLTTAIKHAPSERSNVTLICRIVTRVFLSNIGPAAAAYRVTTIHWPSPVVIIIICWMRKASERMDQWQQLLQQQWQRKECTIA